MFVLLSYLTTISVFYHQGKCNILDLIVIPYSLQLSLFLQILHTSHTDILSGFPVLQGPCISWSLCLEVSSTLVKFFSCQFKYICLREVSPNSLNCYSKYDLWAIAALENLLEIQKRGPYSRLTESKTAF